MSPVRVGINGFGRIGRLALRAAWGGPGLEFVHVNELDGDVATSAHLLSFDSVQGRWRRDVRATGDELVVDGVAISHSSIAEPGAVAWTEHGVDVVLECTGRFRTMASLEPYLEQGVGR